MSLIPRKIKVEGGTKERPWWVPYHKKFGYTSFNIGIEITLNLKAFKDPETTRQLLEDFEERYGKYIVFTTCPECGWRVPACEITIHGSCSFCLARKREDES